MQDDFTVFWRNDAHASALFYDLLARSERGAYDDDFLRQLAAYRAASPESERADIFAARYLLAQNDPENAVICGERAYTKRPMNYEVWKILALAYKQLGRELEAITMQGYCYGLYRAPSLDLNLTEESLKEGLGRLTIALGSCLSMPSAQSRAYVRNDRLAFCSDAFLGEDLPLPMPEGSTRFWSACYAENTGLSEKSYLMEEGRYADWFASCGHRDFTFRLQKARETMGHIRIDLPAGENAILPIAGTEPEQPLTIKTASGTLCETYLGKWAFSFYRLDESAELISAADAPYAVGMPVLLRHSPHRRKLVLNILVDGLSWPIMRPHANAYLPNITRFFAQGVTFDQHFSVSEYTLTAYPSIETGYYPHHTNIFNGKVSTMLPADMPTIAERMTELGYYCTAPMASGQGVTHGLLRGFDQAVTASWVLPSSEGVERTIRQIRAFDETDQFLLLFVTDVHPYDALGSKFDTAVETHLPLKERSLSATKTVSVRLPCERLYQDQYLERAQQLDRNLGMLFTYLEEHFTKDEYLVNLYSDHGVPIFGTGSSGALDIISAYSTGATWMIRGAGVPAGITVSDLTSAVDLYPTLGHLCGFSVSPDVDGGLPAIFGGKERDAAYSMSLFPGQTYKLAVRTHEHTLRLETHEVVDEDGTVDFAGAKLGIYPRGHELDQTYLIDSDELRAFFYPRARDFVRTLANNGEFWPAMRAARPDWFGEGE